MMENSISVVICLENNHSQCVFTLSVLRPPALGSALGHIISGLKIRPQEAKVIQVKLD